MRVEENADTVWIQILGHKASVSRQGRVRGGACVPNIDGMTGHLGMGEQEWQGEGQARQCVENKVLKLVGPDHAEREESRIDGDDARQAGGGHGEMPPAQGINGAVGDHRPVGAHDCAIGEGQYCNGFGSPGTVTNGSVRGGKEA